MENVIIRQARVADLDSLHVFARALGKPAAPDYYVHQLEKQQQGERLVLLIEHEDRLAGYCILNWRPKYSFFNKMGFSEIQDLNIHPARRRLGLASCLIAYCEELARAKGHEYIGLGVGVHKGFGPAQILYVKLGYIPDGYGLNYDRQPISVGEFRPVDDDLCLMMIKALDNTAKTTEN